MQRVISHAKQRLWNGKNQAKNGTRFCFSTVPSLRAMIPLLSALVPLLTATVPLLVERVTNKSHYRCT